MKRDVLSAMASAQMLVQDLAAAYYVPAAGQPFHVGCAERQLAEVAKALGYRLVRSEAVTTEPARVAS